MIDKPAVLLVNLGTPDAPEEEAVRRYLKEFLSDRRVVSLPPIIWQPILRLFVLRSRPAKSAEAYAQIWSEAGSPLLAITREQAHALAERLGTEAHVDYAMRYGKPSLLDRLTALRDAGVTQLLVAPLYPQYCTATTATVEDEVHRILKRLGWKPELRWLAPYYEAPAYIDALAQSITASLAALPFVPERLIASFHGMPERTRRKGDPYYDHCLRTADLLAERLGQPVMVSFQSRFGAEKWLQPYTDAVLGELADEGIRKVAIVAPGFSADCLETLEELALRGRDQFLAAGGSDFAYLPCLNASPPGMDMMEQLIRDTLTGNSSIHT